MSGNGRAGVDIGGTFTDVVTIENGRVATQKTPSTPAAPEDAVTHGLEAAAEAGDLTLSALQVLAHGTTVATNAVLEETFATTALLTTEGFRDVLEIGRQTRPDIYDHEATKPDPVVPRHRRHEVPERLDERGTVIASLDETAVRETIQSIDGDVDSVAICLLFAYENAEHEKRVAELVRECRDVTVSRSSTVHPEIREYERTLATALNAALQPIIDSYLEGLQTDLTDLAPAADLRVMGSNGGTMTAETARQRPVRTLLSGPAAGVRGAAHVAKQAGFSDVLTMDMGGTSCDVSLVQEGEPTISTSVTVGDYPVTLPMVDIHTVGAGGGSIAWLDSGEALRVGPRSAGAQPGPVCYGRGGEQPTTTDAQVLLGRIEPTGFIETPASREAVVSAMDSAIANPLEMSTREAASAVLRVSNATMERALRVVSVERGHDPRELTLVAFGGAGPLHATALAPALDIPRVLVPPAAGVLSALGLLASDLLRDFSRSMVRELDELDSSAIESVFAELTAEAREALSDAGIPADRREFERSLDLRYTGQTYDLTIPIHGQFDADTLSTVTDRFHDRHAERYGHASPSEPIELVTVRVRACGTVDPPDLSPPTRSGSLTDAVSSHRSVTVEDTVQETPVYNRGEIPLDATIEGPALIEGGQSTVFVRPDQEGTFDKPTGSLLVEVSP